jgi:hypothetical protein
MEKLKASLRKLIQHPYFVPGCLLIGVVLRLLWIWLVRADQVNDFVWFQERAVSIASGAGYAVDGRPTAYWPVGYPGFLGVLFSIFGPSVLLAKLVNLVLYMGIIALTYSFTKEIFHSEYSGRIALAILCIYPNHIAAHARLGAHSTIDSRRALLGSGHADEAATHFPTAAFFGDLFQEY